MILICSEIKIGEIQTHSKAQKVAEQLYYGGH